jgi:opacity protein-like surface antigen
MKKLIIILALTLGGAASAQCRAHSDSPSSVFATFSGGFAKTMNAELSLRIKSIHIGAGAGVMVDNTLREKNDIIYTRNDHAYFVNLGYQKDKVFLGGRIGNRTLVHVTKINTHRPDEHEFMIGALIGYSITPRMRFNLGYDSFNQANLGVAFGL